jgi:hypothetical protein
MIVTDKYLEIQEEEIKEMKNMLKKYKLGIKFPKSSKYSSNEEYENALDRFYKFMVNFLPSYLKNSIQIL